LRECLWEASFGGSIFPRVRHKNVVHGHAPSACLPVCGRSQQKVHSLRGLYTTLYCHHTAPLLQQWSNRWKRRTSLRCDAAPSFSTASTLLRSSTSGRAAAALSSDDDSACVRYAIHLCAIDRCGVLFLRPHAALLRSWPRPECQDATSRVTWASCIH
jgi:hypothetical protein